MEEIDEIARAVKSKEDFIRFVEALIKDLNDNPDDWENKTLETYLDALASWTESMENYYINTGQPVPKRINWKVFADILMAATMYE
jgi:hypothetical protein